MKRQIEQLILWDQDGRFLSTGCPVRIQTGSEFYFPANSVGGILDEVFASLKKIADSFGDEIERPDSRLANSPIKPSDTLLNTAWTPGPHFFSRTPRRLNHSLFLLCLDSAASASRAVSTV